MPAVRDWEGTQAKGTCEPGQAGRCSPKQRTLVPGSTSLGSLPRALFFPVVGSQWSVVSGERRRTTDRRLRITDMAKQQASPPAAEPAAPEGYTVLARRY